MVLVSVVRVVIGSPPSALQTSVRPQIGLCTDDIVNFITIGREYAMGTGRGQRIQCRRSGSHDNPRKAVATALYYQPPASWKCWAAPELGPEAGGKSEIDF